AGNAATVADFDSLTDPSNAVDTSAPSIAADALSLATQDIAGDAKTDNLKQGDKVVLTIALGEAADGFVGLPTTGSTNDTAILVNAVGVSADWSTSGNNLILTYTVTASQNGAITIDEAALKTALGSSITDKAGNAATVADFDSLTDPSNAVDTSAPSIVANALSVTTRDSGGSTKSTTLQAGDKVVLTIDLGEAADNLVGLPETEDSSVILINGEAKTASWSTDNNSLALTYELTAGDSGPITIDEEALKTILEESGITDLAGNAATVAEFNNLTDPSNTVDTSGPNIGANALSVTTQNSTGAAKSANLKEGDKVVLTIALGEAASVLSGLPTSDDTSVIKVGGAAKTASWSISGNNLILTYTVGASDSGAITVDEAALKTALGTNIKDAAGNAATVATFNNLTDPSNVVDNTGPSIGATALSLATQDSTGSAKSANLKEGDKVVLTIDLGEAASGLTGLPTSDDSSVIEVGGAAKTASWSTSGNNLTLTYTVGASDSGAITVDEAALKTALGSNIKDAAGNTATIATFNNLSDPGNAVDTSAPSIGATALSLETQNGAGDAKSVNLKEGDKVVLTIDLGEDASGLTGLPADDVSTVIQVGGAGKSASWSTSGNNLTLTYTVGANDSGAITVDEAALKTALGSSITDKAGNAATVADFTTLTDPSNEVDNTGPTLQSSNPADDGTVSYKGKLTFTFNEEVQLGSAGTIQIKALDGATDVTIDLANLGAHSVTLSSNKKTLTVDPSSNLEVGKQYAVRIDNTVITDLAGNAYAGIADDSTLNFTTTNPPPPPVPATIDLRTIEGISSPDVTIKLFDASNNLIGTTTADGQGYWVLENISQFDGTFEGSVTATDANGNVSSPTPVSETANSNAPSAPIVLTANASGLSGTGQPSTIVYLHTTAQKDLYDTQHQYDYSYRTLVDEVGQWFIDSSQFPGGEIDGFTGYVTLKGMGGPSSEFTFIPSIDGQAPDAPVLDTANAAGLSGTTEANITITLFDANDEMVTETQSNQDGHWSIAASALPGGTSNGFVGKLKAKDAAGNVSLATTVSAIDGLAPNEPVLQLVGASGISGLAEANATIELLDANSQVVASTQANGSGQWSIAAASFPGGTATGFVGSVTAKDAAGNVSDPRTVSVVEDTTPPEPAQLSVANAAGLSGSAEAYATVFLYNTSDQEIASTNADASGQWHMAANTIAGGLSDGFEGSIKVRDLGGNVSDATAVTAVDAQAPTVTITDDASGTAYGVVTYTFSFSESVGTSFTLEDITVSSGFTASQLTKVDDSTYTVEVTPSTASGSGNLVVGVRSGGVSDAAGNALAQAAQADAQPYLIQKAGDEVIDLGSHGQLILGLQVEGNWYYVLDRGPDPDGVLDFADRISMDDLLAAGLNSGTFNGVQLQLPSLGLQGAATEGAKPGTAVSSPSETNSTYDGLLAIWDAYNGSSLETFLDPSWPWPAPGQYWSSTTIDGSPTYLNQWGQVWSSDGASQYYAVLQVM
ncbi:Ig-like domain-containing protein, partial [Limnohabitans sp.]|uniref:Ig-like domain-containing protein n=1 Tax=Limnohabitans sp. TaxID=1907725 RepID=UPI00311FAB54